MLFHSFIVFLQLKNGKLCTTCRALIGFLNSFLKYDASNSGCEVTINVWKDHQPISTVLPRKATFLPKVIFAQMQSNKFKKLHIIYTTGKNFR